MTVQNKILNYMKKNGVITKDIAAKLKFTCNLGEYIRRIREARNEVETVMVRNARTNKQFAEYHLRRLAK